MYYTICHSLRPSRISLYPLEAVAGPVVQHLYLRHVKVNSSWCKSELAADTEVQGRYLRRQMSTLNFQGNI